MSCDFAVWFPDKKLTDKQAGDLYRHLCESDVSGVQPHPSVDAFYNELTAKHPEIDTVPDDRIDDHDYCPWSCAFDRSPGHIIMCSVWPKADYVGRVVHELGRKHGLVVYDPQSYKVTYPDDPIAFPASRNLERRNARFAVLVFLFVLSTGCILLGTEGKTIAGCPAEYFGYFLA